MKQFLAKNKFILFLLLLILLLRIPSLFEPYWYGDEGVYLTLGQGIRKGLLLYRDIFDNKTPLIYLLAAAANGALSWLRFFLLIAVLASDYFFYRLAQKIFSGQEKPARVATVLFSLLTSIPLLEGNIANAEIFILLPTILGFNLLFSLTQEKLKEKNFFQFFVAGLIFSLGLLLKVPAGFDFLVALTFLIFLTEKNKFFNFGRREILLLAGYLSPLLLTAAFFWLKGSFTVFFNSCFLQTAGYLSSWQSGSHAFSWLALLKSELSLKGLLVLGILSGLWFQRKKLGSFLTFVILWFVLALFSATLSGRPYAHYLIQVLPPFSLALGFLVSKKRTGSPAVAGVIFLLFLTILRYRFWVYPTVPYYGNFIRFALGAKDKNSYFAYFDRQTPQSYRLAEFIAANSTENDKIFIWGDDPYLYALSRRLPATPFVVAYHILDLKKEEETLTILNQEKPNLIIVDKKTKDFPALEVLIRSVYLKIETDGDFTVYRRRAS